jgi:hypothetical protein
MPLNIGSGNDSRRLLELIGGLEAWSAICGRRYGMETIGRGLESMGIEPNIPVNPRNGRKPTI